MRSELQIPPMTLPPSGPAPQVPRRGKAAVLLLLLLVVAIALRVILTRWVIPVYQARAITQVLQNDSLLQLEQATQLRPIDSQPFYYLGLRWQALGNERHAEVAFAQAARRDPDDAAIWLAWATLAGSLDSDQNERQILTAFVQKHPNNAAVHLALGQSEQLAGEDAAAILDAQAVLALAPHDARAWRLLADAARHQNQLSQAADDLRQAIADDGQDADDYLALTDLLNRTGHTAEIADVYTQAVQKLPQDAVIFMSLGQAQLAAARSPEEIAVARETLARSTVLGPDLSPAYVLLGASYCREGRWTEARVPLEHAATLPPGEIGSRMQQSYLLAQVDTHLGDAVGATRARRRHERLLAYVDQKDQLIDRIRKNPVQMPLRLQLARLCAAQGEDADAISVYRRLLEYAPADAVARRELAMVVLKVQRAQSPQTASAEKTPPVPPALLRRDADALLAGKQYQAAETAYARIVLLDKKDALAYQGMGMAAQALGQETDAFNFFRQALTLNSHLAAAQSAVAQQYHQAGFPNIARQHYEIATQSAPLDADAWHELGLVCRESSTYAAEGLDALRHAATLQPSNAAFILDLADALDDAQQKVDAESNYRHALALKPNDADALSRLAGFLIRHQAANAPSQEAASLLHQALARDPSNDYAWFQQGQLYFAQRDYPRAIADLQHAALLAPNTAEVWYILSRADSAQGEQNNAKLALANFDLLQQRFAEQIHLPEKIALNPTDPKLHLRLARVDVAAGEIAQAISQYEQCLRLAPGQAAVRQELARLEAHLKATGHLPSMTIFYALQSMSAKP